uniref:Uncharacterized protein n=1 Tax=Glossina morsitans morsitans TaxID=37546 RepID=A0ABK9NGF8_GLOMM
MIMENPIIICIIQCGFIVVSVVVIVDIVVIFSFSIFSFLYITYMYRFFTEVHFFLSCLYPR